ncbi:MAG: hypothetical protein AB7V27_18230 [Candidatus Binatia bacterium]
MLEDRSLGRFVIPFLAFLVGAALMLAVASESLGARAPARSGDPSIFPPFQSLPGVSDADVAALWELALREEREGDFAAAAATYEQLAVRLPTAAAPRWRAAKNHWDAGGELPENDVEGRRRAYAHTRAWAERGIDVDPQCGECRLYMAAGLGGEARDRGAIVGALQVSDIADLLERGIELVSRQPDAESNPELEELYYAAALLYSRVPDSGVLRWALGVPGDRKRAIAYMRRAAELSEQRPTYQVELGRLLVCTGTAEDDSALMAEGFTVLQTVLARPADEVAEENRRRAQELVDSPRRVCDS